MRTLPALLASLSLLLAGAAQAAAPVVFQVTLGAAAHAPVSGRLLIFAKPLEAAKAEAKGQPISAVDAGALHPRETAVAALEVRELAPGASVAIDADLNAFPQSFSTLPDGVYAVQAVLDQNHSYNYLGRGAGDLVSPVTELRLSAGGSLTLTSALSAEDAWTAPEDVPAAFKAQLARAKTDARRIDFESPVLSKFWGRPIAMRAWVLTPPGYASHPDSHYPTVFYTHGFGGNLDRLTYIVAYVDQAMASGEAPPMIWVFLDESSPTGTHEFADSVNNGPWGQALTTELIPALEKTYRMDARPSGRFLNGHSSGGWATLWLQTRYPAFFGGTWSTSPDPSDFHDFTGVDLYAADANVYRRADGSLYPIMRDQGKVLAHLQDFAQLEAVLGDYGGQMSSFDWVFSPRGEDGRPEPMFSRATGEVNPKVVAYWRDHYDIAYRIKRDWPSLKPNLDGKIHVIVGTADTFYLDGAAHGLQAVLDGLGAKSQFTFLPDRTHMDVYVIGDDRRGLLKKIAWEMYAIARPHAPRPAAAPGQT
jgi:enterochelin esterase-like enzyme